MVKYIKIELFAVLNQKSQSLLYVSGITVESWQDHLPTIGTLGSGVPLLFMKVWRLFTQSSLA